MFTISSNVNALNGVGTVPVALGQFPSLVTIGIQGNEQLCHGIVINNNHILTAGGCVLTNDNHNHLRAANTINVRGGIIAVGGGTPIVAQRIYVHPTYNPNTLENDLAVIRVIDLFKIKINIYD